MMHFGNRCCNVLSCNIVSTCCRLHTVTTAEGIRIGSTRSEVEEAYGDDCFNGTNTCELTKGNSKLTILVTDGLVSAVRYEGIPD